MANIETAVLENSMAQVLLLNLGCITQCWQLAGWPTTRSAVLGYADPANYERNPHYLGAIIGRVANRIEGGQFSLNTKLYKLDQNEGSNTLHGGSSGLSQRIWEMDRDGTSAVQFRLLSKDGEQGFPGTVAFSVTVVLEGSTLTYDLQADVSEPTPINMTQHNYYNLNGAGTIAGHCLQIPADKMLSANKDGIPKQVCSVTGTPYDFNQSGSLTPKLARDIDTSYCLKNTQNLPIKLTNQHGAHLKLETNQSGLQVYTAGKLTNVNTPFGSQNHNSFSGICLEPQAYPNAVNRSDFPSIIAFPDAPYRNTLKLTLTDEYLG
ncbi:galactose mutarotase [Amylibacter sp.]|nr:galactose mutarotase [Amylibacter sp.]